MKKTIQVFIITVLMVCGHIGYSQNPSEYQHGVKRGDAGAMYNLASCYFNPQEGMTNDYGKALKLYEKAAAKGHVESMYMVAYMCYHGIGTEYDFIKSWDYAQSALMKGFKPSAWLLAKAIKDGNAKCPVEDYCRYLQQAADAELAVAQVELGIEYLEGNENFGIKKNCELGASWIRKAADKKDSKALYFLGKCYENGWGVGRIDKSRADVYYNSSAEGGYPDALVLIGESFLHKKAYAEAYKYFELAKDKGNGEACYQLGQMYSKSLGVEQDSNAAFEMYKRGAELGHSDALCSLANMYLTGDVIPKNEEEAFKSFGTAASQGSVAALFGLGVCYRDGLGTKSDWIKAYSYFKEAYEKKYSPAQEAIAQCLWEGIGTSINKSKALSYYEAAANSGSISAKFELGRIFYEDPDFLDYFQSYDYLQNTIKDKDFENVLDNESKGIAYHYLAAICRFGYGVVIADEKKAFDYDEKAAFYGNAAAKKAIKVYQEN